MLDAIVIGLGGMGSAAAYHLSKRGLRVLGLEQFTPAHALGSSHGESRIIRQAYYEDPAYVPLARRAYELWDELQRTVPDPIWRLTGGLTIGYESAPIVTGALKSAQLYGVPIDRLTLNEARRRFPAFTIHDGEVALFEPSAGALFPEKCVQAHLQAAGAHGAGLRFNEKVRKWNARETSVTVELESGEKFEAERLVLCAGPWINEVCGDSWPVKIERNVQHWFTSTNAALAAGLPIYLVQRENGPPMFYGFPDFGGGLKIAFHHSEVYAPSPEHLKRAVEPQEADAARRALTDLVGDLAGDCIRSVACMYTMTPDEHFIIGQYPGRPSVIVAGGFSGHGFKFCSVVGEILAQLVSDGHTDHPVQLFAPDRFSAEATSTKR